jgi:hypothetical protein
MAKMSLVQARTLARIWGSGEPRGIAYPDGFVTATEARLIKEH